MFNLQTNGKTKAQNSNIEAYLQGFVNFVQNNWVMLFLMAKFVYKNTKNSNNNCTHFELDCGYHLCVFFKKNKNSHFYLKTADKLVVQLQQLLIVYYENFYCIPKIQKQVHNKIVKLRNYAPSDKIWLNSKYFQTKNN